jgi:hypothetical protein
MPSAIYYDMIRFYDMIDMGNDYFIKKKNFN